MLSIDYIDYRTVTTVNNQCLIEVIIMFHLFQTKEMIDLTQTDILFSWIMMLYDMGKTVNGPLVNIQIEVCLLLLNYLFADFKRFP